MRLFTCILLLVVGFGGGEAFGSRPWSARRPPAPPTPAHQLVDVHRWPEEPPAPEAIDGARFRQALAYLCRLAPEKVPADEVLTASRDAGVDPFLLAALMADRSHCDRKWHVKGSFGLLGIQPTLYGAPDAPPPPANKSDWQTKNLLDVQGNLGLGARLLRMWEEQHEAIDAIFGGSPHRSAVSHFYFGDVVGSSGNEDLVLTARRRMLDQYDQHVIAPHQSPLGVAIVPPLDAVPRVATSGPGDDRDGGARRHRGLDVAASVGEPVHAIADGTVIFAGANLPSSPHTNNIPPAKIGRYTHRRLGTGGIYLCIRHSESGPGEHGVVSCYMHLDRYFVANGDKVSAGETIALVGRTGVKRSPPHLHLEVRIDDQCNDPWRYFSDTIIPPRDTLTHRFNVRAQRARLKALRTTRPSIAASSRTLTKS